VPCSAVTPRGVLRVAGPQRAPQRGPAGCGEFFEGAVDCVDPAVQPAPGRAILTPEVLPYLARTA